MLCTTKVKWSYHCELSCRYSATRKHTPTQSLGKMGNMRPRLGMARLVYNAATANSVGFCVGKQ